MLKSNISWMQISSLRRFIHNSTSLKCKSLVYDSNQWTERNQSYVHHTDSKPLVYRNLGQHLRIAADQYPYNEAIVSCHEAKRYTYSEVLEKVDRMAAAFQQLGLEKGDRIGIWLPNGMATYLTILAAARAGLIWVGINPAFQLPELEYTLKKVDVKALITTETFRTQKYYEMLKELIPELPESRIGDLNSSRVPTLKSIIVDSGTKKLPGTISIEDLCQLGTPQRISEINATQHLISPDDGACLLLTSGTTGQPKAALLSHFGLVNNGIHGAYRNEFDRSPHRVCVQVPAFHVFGLTYGIVAMLGNGSTAVFPGAGFNASESLRAIAEERCTSIYGTPTMYVDLMSELSRKPVKLHRLDMAMFGAAVCSPKLMLDFKEAFGVEKIRIGYGMTESSGTIFMADREDGTDVALGSVGRVLDHYEAKVVDRNGNVVPFGMAGELYVRGYGIMLNYWGDESKTKEVLDRDGWYKTGDQFVLRPDGYGNIVGRLKEVIIRGGENIYPRELEDLLNTHPDILESHCIGVPDERLGEEVCAYIRVEDSAEGGAINLESLKKFCKNKIAHFKIPRHLRIVDHFPKTVSGKIQKYKLLQMYLDENKR